MSETQTSQWSLSDVAVALAVPPRRMLSGWSAAGVSIDSRSLQPGEIFVCVRGERTDGHEYIRQALAAGAAALVVEEQAALVKDLGLPHPTQPIAVFLVEDGLIALQELARFHRNRMSGRVFGITGSNGKTSAKEMLAGMLAALPDPASGTTSAADQSKQSDQSKKTKQTGPAKQTGQTIGPENVAATHGNLNNHFGVPLTLLAMPADIPYAVVEMGMNHAGEIELLSRIARPHRALITGVAPVHIENFPDLTGIARAKLEIAAGLSPGGSLVYPAAATGQELARAAARSARAELIVFSVGDIESPGAGGIRFAWRDLRIHAPAYHNPVMASNLTAVLELLNAEGFAPKDLASAAATVTPRTGRRFEIIKKPRGAAGPEGDAGVAPQLLVDDSYNANPTSFIRAAEALRALLPEGRLACFAGEMGELGPEHGLAGHREVGAVLARQGYEFVGVCGGKHAEALKDTFVEATAKSGKIAGQATGPHASVQDLLAELEAGAGLSGLAGYDGVLIKGSRSARMDVLCDALRKHSYI
ncbi:MAG: UDP-N-acetylmuramoyl-tripeptide--D-alanyl-D-alanine ligase [bacterium]|nr:UDP-N-acetylmuramoyl-tripeptide--D-alanyl-D-alanine ligase [bacterium]